MTGKYWAKVAEERRRNPFSILLADKNAPNEEVWRQVILFVSFLSFSDDSFMQIV